MKKSIKVFGVHRLVKSGRGPYRVELKGDEEMDASDGYHTFTELYEHRVVLFIALCRFIHSITTDQGHILDVWRSKLHSDGSSYDGWFVLGIGRKKGEQITYHLPMSKWNETSFAQTRKKAFRFDGHTSFDVLKRLKSL